jgi:hypothetical protein
MGKKKKEKNLEILFQRKQIMLDVTLMPEA